MENWLYKIGLTLLPNVGPITAKNLISYCGSPEAVFASSTKALLKIPGIGPQTAQYIREKQVLDRAQVEWELMQSLQITPLYYLDDNYPSRLKYLADSPVLLYFKGNFDWQAPRMVAIVGTRKPSHYGVAVCEELIEGLKDYQVAIVSGLAFGIDVCAHRKALECQIPTIGVMGNGLRYVYPAEHRQVAAQMLENGGLLSEYTANTAPEREHFPMRNRIVAGLCDALIVIETQKRGGSMITAQLANGYNKDVFAVPGRVKDKYSEGCNQLIKAHQAALAESVADIAYVMRWEECSKTKAVQGAFFQELDEKEQMIISLIGQGDAVGIDALTATAKMHNSEMAGLLLELEFKGLIKALPGNRYALI
ncbi:MAG TPA: DNA-processing protein DprA [Saprospiraceae bacterium]|nr:DNA-processing protein DprA [Saprospiraceae bacterium]HMQ84172.1 DNA-processing protein DprA [Saprospiraceae bacterium]